MARTHTGRLGKRLLSSATVGLVIGAASMFAQQRANPTFDSTLDNPTYPAAGAAPRVLFDEAHNNFHTADGRYRPFVDLVRADGYEVVRNKDELTLSRLQDFDILIISNALGRTGMRRPAQGPIPSAFTPQECTAIEQWVSAGGSLLLIADHAPIGAASRELAQRFGVEMSDGFVRDEENSRPTRSSWLRFSRANGLLGDHPILQGRNSGERVNRIETFAGQALKSSSGVSLLKLSLEARVYPARNSPDQDSRPATGGSQGLALQHGKGRTVVLGEAAAWTSQSFPSESSGVILGMSASNDNQKMVLNIMHWLSGLI